MSHGFDVPEFSFENRIPNDKTGRMRRLLDCASDNSKTAAGVIENAKKAGCRFDFMSGIDGYIGFFDMKTNAVCLNVMLSNEELMTALVHESRHAVQPLCSMSADRNIRTNLQINRSKEADATAFECAAAYEMRKTYPKAWRAFKKDHAAIAVAYAKAVKSKKRSPFALGEAFKAWHSEADYVAEYDKDVVRFLAMREKSSGGKFLSGNMTPREIENLFCRHTGKPYLDEPDFLSSSAALSVDFETMRQIKALSKRLGNNRTERDKSVDELILRHADVKTRIRQAANPPRPAVFKFTDGKRGR